MSIDEHENSETCGTRASRITLDMNTDIASAGKLHKKLKKCASRNVDVNLVAENVASIDTTALQLLLCFVREVRDSGHHVYWQSTSEAVLRTAELTGVLDELGLSGAS